MPVTGGAAGVTQKALRILLCATAVVLLFSLYTWVSPGIHQVSTSTSLRPRITLASSPELGLVNSARAVSSNLPGVFGQ
jgi:hypothetical protein